MASRALALISGLLLVSCTSATTPHGAAISRSPQASPRAWLVLSSPQVGVTFSFPPLPGTVRYTYETCPPHGSNCLGPFYVWEVTRTDSQDQGHGYAFAGFTAAYDATFDGWPTNVGPWGHDAKGYWVSNGGHHLKVDAVKEISTPNGSKALVFRPGGLSCDGCTSSDFPYLKDLAVVVTFARTHGGFRCLDFYFEDPTPLSQIERVINSVSFTS